METIIIGIAGGTASGKTTVAKKVFKEYAPAISHYFRLLQICIQRPKRSLSTICRKHPQAFHGVF